MSDEYDVVMTHTAKSKEYRYLRAWEITQRVNNPGAVYYDSDRDTYMIPVTREQHNSKWNHSREEKVVLVVDLKPDGTAVIVTQTGDHYDWGDYEKVDAIGDADEQ